MTRTPPTTAELALIAEVSRCGLTATHHQFERWRAKRWLAPADQWTDPATGALRYDIVHRAAWLAALSRPGRAMSWIGWTFWATDDTEQSAALLRRALIRTIQLPLRQAGITLAQIPQGDSDTAFEVRQDLAERLLQGRRAIGRDLDGLLREHAATAGIALPEPGTVSNPFDATLIRVGARLLTGGMADVSPEELTDAWRSVWTGPPEQLDRITAAHLAADETGTDLRALSPLAHGLPGLVRAFEQADAHLLCEAVHACTKASSTLMKLLMERADTEMLTTLMTDPIWEQWVRAGGIAPVSRLGEAAITLSTVQYLLVPGWAEGLHRYQDLMDRLLAAPTAPASDGRPV
ncbi:hypothetical protein [Streptomyces stelliscabiei]|uniref:hypothetical protein n=1 Tax=Streptomyces stelliscabiei TaxID=146820 RepID=UPI0029B379BC|nr:hypothetical protein [Streptomyces stelliscabiei]MDX2557263.1 hypothetical protein [Streptomyces stelliscabiei]MDX2616347.1 hypothetical protein [Streptomyces stelliscabiei]MDX2641048.1 hypothetical protein [Streptomyces stelliscabiei]MDX2665110.1 hypothetical protein [Streptomyces stelliscabiei]MDX2716215.1 hypothetical protein [Streptomyces stelliscabiei]